MPSLTYILSLGLVAACAVILVQELVPLSWRLVKPWGCVFCLSVHSSWIIWLALDLACRQEPVPAGPIPWLAWLAGYTAAVAGATPVSMIAVKVIKALTKFVDDSP